MPVLRRGRGCGTQRPAPSHRGGRPRAAGPVSAAADSQQRGQRCPRQQQPAAPRPGARPSAASRAPTASPSTGIRGGPGRGRQHGVRAQSRSARSGGPRRHRGPAASSGPGARLGQRLAGDAGQRPGLLDRPKASAPRRPPGRAGQLLGRRAAAARVETASRSSICTNRPDSGRVDHSALAVTWNSTTCPSPTALARDQRRAVGQRGDDAVGQGRVGLGHDLRADRDVGRNRQPEEGRGRRGRGAAALGSPQLIAPPTLRPPARSRTGISGSPRRGRRPRPPAAARRSAPAGRRFSTQSSSGPARPRPAVATSASTITSGLASSTSDSVPLDQVGRRRQRLLEVVGRRQQLAAPRGRRAGDQRHLAPVQRVVGQASPPRPSARPRSRTGSPGCAARAAATARASAAVSPAAKAIVGPRQLARRAAGVEPVGDHASTCASPARARRAAPHHDRRRPRSAAACSARTGAGSRRP